MNTVKTDFRIGQEAIKRLFQELFRIQIQLEVYNNFRFSFYDEIKALIEIIDELMQILLTLFDS